MQFHFNFFTVEFLLDQRKVLEQGDVPQIINNDSIEDNFLVAHWRKKG